ncbi:MAG: hypothetical protein U0T74_03415 [Chitinophagales bacterium]
METLRQQLFTGWHFMRWLRLGIGIYIAIQAVMMKDTIMGFFSAIFLVQAFTNTGCCGTQACAVPKKNSQLKNSETVEFEEIKK